MTQLSKPKIYFDGEGIKKEGILLIDKQGDWTSHDVVAVCRKYLGLRRIGHAGTLDPMATGLLVMLIGRSATKLQDKFLKSHKKYTAVLKLGEETDTLDAHGTFTKTLPVLPITLEAVLEAAKKLTGTFEHIIPLYSAKKVNGQAMHKLARDEKEIPEQRKKITVFSWSDVAVNGAEISFEVEVSSGTYIRSLGLMLAKELGTTGHLTALRRLSSGQFNVEGAITMEQLKTLPYEELCKFITPV